MLAGARPIEWSDNLTAVEKQKLTLDRQLLVKQTISALELSPEQQALLIPLLETVVADLKNIRIEKEKSMPQFNTAIIKLREDMYINNGITDAVKQCVKNSDCRFTQLEDEYKIKSKARAETIWNMLSSSQKAYLRKGVVNDSPAPSERDLTRIKTIILNGYALYCLKPEIGMPNNDDVVPAAVKSNVTDTRLLNLFNVLFITPDQSSQLMAILKSAKKDYDGWQQRNIEYSKNTLPVMEKIVKDPKLAAQYPDIKSEEKKLEADLAAIDKKYLKMLKEMLTENQVRTIGNFTPIIELLNQEAVISQAGKNNGSDDTDSKITAYLTSANLIPLLQARIDGDVFPPAAKK
jgi:hypothetical protein